MPSDLSLIDGSTYFLSTENGDIEVKSGEGFFHADMRHLSTWQLLIDGEPMYVLASACVDYFSPGSSERSRAPGRERTLRSRSHETASSPAASTRT